MHIRYFKSYTDFQIVNFDVGKKLYKYKIQKNSTFFRIPPLSWTILRSSTHNLKSVIFIIHSHHKLPQLANNLQLRKGVTKK